MKFLLIFAGVVLLQVTGIQCQKKEFEECAKELEIPEDMAKKGCEANKGKPEFRCLHACIMKKGGVLEAGNKVNMDKMKENIPAKLADKADEIVKAHEECMVTAKDITDECDFVNALKKCVHGKFKDLKPE